MARETETTLVTKSHLQVAAFAHLTHTDLTLNTCGAHLLPQGCSVSASSSLDIKRTNYRKKKNGGDENLLCFRAVLLWKSSMVMEIIVSVVLLFVGIAVLVVIHVCIVGRAFWEGGLRGGLVQRNGNSTTVKLSTEDLKKLPCFEYGSEEKAFSRDVDCADRHSSSRKQRQFDRGWSNRAECSHRTHIECQELDHPRFLV
ncbi:hypothetical protein NL676_003251 [Syzygium grande]|nr:hypothetical protein NL676_003251 [Syzygium grande]